MQRSEAARVLRETKKQDSIRVDLPRVFDTRKVSQLRDFARDFLGLTAADLPGIDERLTAGVLGVLSVAGSINARDGRGGTAQVRVAEQLGEAEAALAPYEEQKLALGGEA